MEFKLRHSLEILECLIKDSPNRSDFEDLKLLKLELEQVLAEHLQINTCGKKICPIMEDKK